MNVSDVKDRLRIRFDVLQYITYANVINQNSINPIYFEIENLSKQTINNISFKISSSSDVIKDFIQDPFSIDPGIIINPDKIRFEFDRDYLFSLTESEQSTICFELMYKGETIFEEKKITEIATRDYWVRGYLVTNEIGEERFIMPIWTLENLSTFVTPNHPIIKEITSNSTKWLQEFTGNPSLNGYQSGDPNRVRQMVAAIYAEIQKRNIVYSEPPTSFNLGQRIRLCEDIDKQHLGTCMDLSLIFASCLESIGLNPILILHEGHIYSGCWLIDEFFKDSIVFDASQVSKRTVDGINEIVIFECTSVCAGKSISFDEACRISNDTITSDNFEAIIDIHALRLIKNYKPLPLRVENEEINVIHSDREQKDITGKAKELESYDFDIEVSNKQNKVSYWERKLLDITTRNTLISLRKTTGIQFPINSLSEIEDRLNDGVEFSVQPIEIEEKYENTFEFISRLGEEKIVKDEFSKKRILTIGTEKSINRALTKIHRQAKTAKEESGSSSLFLATGLLKWKDNSMYRYAPLVLIPMNLVRKIDGNYSLVKRDEDTEFNITLLEMLKQDYSIDLSGLDPLPLDSHGVDMKKIFNTVSRAIMNKEGWEIVNICVLANFSYNQQVMYNDLHLFSDKLARNKLVRGLINGVLDYDTSVKDDVDEGDVYLPVSVDDSQLHAIKMAEKGYSFVLDGPPGTGKSQTITAMIANALAKGKTVLFVAEKMAALEVVDNRLKEIGLDPFCLELHSNKTTKKNFLEQIQLGIDLPNKGIKSNLYKNSLEDINETKKELDIYSKELHKKRECGLSIRELISLYESLDCHEIMIDYNSIKHLNSNDLNNKEKIVESFISSANTIDKLQNIDFGVFNINEISNTQAFEINEEMNNYIYCLENLKNLMNKAYNKTSINECKNIEDWNNLIEIINNSKTSENIIYEDPDISDVLNVADSLKKFVTKRDELQKVIEKVENKWGNSFFEQDIALYEERFNSAQKKLMFKKKELQNIKNEIQGFTVFHIDDDLTKVFEEIKEYNNSKNELKTLIEELTEEEKNLIDNYPTAVSIDKYVEEIKNERELIARQEYERKQAEELARDLERKPLIEIENEISNIESKEKALIEKGINISSFKNCDIETQKNYINTIIEGLSHIKDWLLYKENLNKCRENSLEEIAKEYENTKKLDGLLDKYNKGVYKSLLLGLIKENKELNNFSGISFNSKIELFKKMDDDLREITRKEIYYILAHKLDNESDDFEASKELNILRRAIQSKGRGYSIRSIFAEIPNILTKICPCVLMSPISVAQYLSPETPPFDLVIFDEASQIPTCKAVGVLARGENAVIVGDNKQMPPTSFFASNDFDENNAQLEDLESILDDCLTLNIPQTHLQWHYRSKHESLIAFSNREFYANRMLTFPSVNDQELRVKYVKVKGYYKQREGINEAESRSIVEEIKRRYKDPILKRSSIGVISFNVKQQEYIEDLLLEEYKLDPEFDAWANERENEKLFVKNLENVQGDERDIIMFSILYGPNQKGNTSLNFGPLNREGGSRRLNVAASRAKEEMILFSIMSFDMINLSKSNSEGVRALRDFLEYAETGKLSRFYEETNISEGIIIKIVDAINEAGYECRRNVGRSEFKIDIAVINPLQKDEYLLGILLDGENYSNNNNTRDREVAQISVLNGLGWNLHRIWSIDFFSNPERELNKIITELDQLKNSYIPNPKANINDIMTVDVDYIPKEEDKKQKKIEPKYEKRTYQFQTGESKSVLNASKIITKNSRKRTTECQEYIKANLKKIVLDERKLFDADIQDLLIDRINEIVYCESPISLDECIKRVCDSCSLDNIDSLVKEALNKAIKKSNCKLQKNKGRTWIWKSGQEPDDYNICRHVLNRDINDICQKELVNALCYVLEEKIVLDEDNLILEAARCLEIFKTSDDIIKQFKEAIKEARKRELIKTNSEKRYLRNLN